MPEQAPAYPWTFAGGRLKKTGLVLALCLLVAVISTAGYLTWGLPDVTVLKNANPKTTALMILRLQSGIDSGNHLKLKQKWVSFATIPQLLKDTVRIAEDAGFYQHNGIDLGEIRAAVRQSWREKRPVRGASTITQQLAKNLYLSPQRSLWRKMKEFLIARRLEAALSKDRIFGLYLNVIELGPGVFGVEAASQHYFGKSVEALNLEEIVRLTAIIPRPLKAHPLKSGRWLNWRARWILGALSRYGYITAEEYRAQIEKFQ